MEGALTPECKDSSGANAAVTVYVTRPTAKPTLSVQCEMLLLQEFSDGGCMQLQTGFQDSQAMRAEGAAAIPTKYNALSSSQASAKLQLKLSRGSVSVLPRTFWRGLQFRNVNMA